MACNYDVKEIDSLHDSSEYTAVYERLKPLAEKPACQSDVEFKWRWARAIFKFGGELPKNEEKPLVLQAFNEISQVVTTNEQSAPAHKWYGIILNKVCEYEGTKKVIEKSFELEKHWMRAHELDPTDPTALHCLGNWHFSVADVSWVKRKLAATLFAKPPESSFENALKYLKQAEQVRPGWYSMNALLLGKTYLKLNQREQAIAELKRASSWPERENDDRTAREESRELLKKLGVQDGQ